MTRNSSSIHSLVCRTIYPYPYPKRVRRRLRSTGSSFSLQYPLLSVRSPGSCFWLLRLLLVTSILLSFFDNQRLKHNIKDLTPKQTTQCIIFSLKQWSLSVVLLGNFGVVLYKGYEKVPDNIPAPITYIAQLIYHRIILTSHKDWLVHLDTSSCYLIPFTMSLIYL
jgi:hypothetical protein